MHITKSIVLALVLCVSATAQDWPQWRGSNLDSVASSDNKIVDALGAETQLWRTPLPGPAGSSPIVTAGKVFVTSVDEDNFLQVLCIDANSGDVVWQKQVKGTNKNTRDSGNSASSSPCTDGKHVWTMFGNGQVNCFTVDGKSVWEKNLQEEYGVFRIQFGMSTTPILHESSLVFALMHGNMRDQKTSIGTIASLNAATGEENWKHTRKTDATAENKHVYASPIIDASGDKPQLIVHGADYTTGHSLADGSELWRRGGMNLKGQNYNPYLRFVSSPVSSGGKLIIPTAKNGPTLALAAGTDTDKQEELWKVNNTTSDVACPVVHGNHVFLAKKKGILSCLDFSTGEELTKQRFMADKHRSTPVAIDGKLVITARNGEVLLVKADPSLEKLSSIELGEECTASPAVADGMIFVRTFDALYAFGSKAKIAPTSHAEDSSFAIAIRRNQSRLPGRDGERTQQGQIHP